MVGAVDIVAGALACANRGDAGRIFGPLSDFFADNFLIAQSLIVDTLAEELVEVKVVLHKEANVAGLELHSLVALDLRVGPHVRVKWAGGVGGALGVPFEAAHSNLESVHATAIVLQLLIAIFRLIKSMCLVIIADR